MNVKSLCLAVLSRGDATGYEIRKQFAEGLFANFQKASFGAIYPALTRAAKEKLVTVTEEAQDGRPDKKVYSLTKAGETALRRACDIDPEPDQIRSDLLFLIFFARYQSPAKIARLVDERIAFYEARQRALDECAMDDTADPGMIFVRGLGGTIYSAAADYLRANRNALLAQLDGEIHHAAE